MLTYPDDDDLHFWTAMFVDAINAHSRADVLTHTQLHTRVLAFLINAVLMRKTAINKLSR